MRVYFGGMSIKRVMIDLKYKLPSCSIVRMGNTPSLRFTSSKLIIQFLRLKIKQTGEVKPVFSVAKYNSGKLNYATLNILICKAT